MDEPKKQISLLRVKQGSSPTTANKSFICEYIVAVQDKNTDKRIRFLEKASRASFFCLFSLSLLTLSFLFDISDHVFHSHK